MMVMMMKMVVMMMMISDDADDYDDNDDGDGDDDYLMMLIMMMMMTMIARILPMSWIVLVLVAWQIICPGGGWAFEATSKLQRHRDKVRHRAGRNC